MIELIDIRKAYAQNKVLNGVNLEWKAGEVHGLVGQNGAGKTTLFQCIAHLEAYQGKIETPFDPLKNTLGYLPTDPYFLPKITGWEYLKLMRVARGIKEEAFEMANIFDLPLDRYAENYSTGMKKKLALLGILLQDNEVFVLDEPFNGVDIQSNILITEIIQRLRSNGKYVLVSSHIFSTLKDTCDSISLLEDGVISKTVAQPDFNALDQQMRSQVIGKEMDRLGL